MITLMVVLNVSEDIEAKIRRLRELGKASAEAELPKTPVPSKPPRKPGRRARSIGSFKEKERRKRILIGVSVILIILLLASTGIYFYLQHRAAWQLEDAKAKKLAELKAYFKPGSELMNSTIGQEKYNDLKRRILSAQSIEELDSIDVKSAYDNAWQEYQTYLQEQARKEYEKKLNQTKEEKIRSIELQFQPLLSMPLPEYLKRKTLEIMNDLRGQIMDSTKIEDVNSIRADPYLLELWREYYYYIIDSIPTQNVIVEKAGFKRILSKDEAKSLLGGILNYSEFIQYRVYRVEYVDIALVLPRDRINGAFLSPGDRIMIFAENRTSKQFREIANDGYIELVLLPKEAARISVSEAQSQSASASSISSNQYSEQRQSEYVPGGNPVTNSQSSTEQYTNSQSSSQSSSASYSYNVDIGEVLKAIAAGKIQAADDVKKQLEEYGWEIIDLEKGSGVLVLDANARFLVIIKVPSIFVPDILSHQGTLYIAKISS